MKKNNHYIPFCKPCLIQNDIDEVIDTLKSGWIGTGPKTKAFEVLFKNYIGCKYAICLNSCTAGLHLALIASGISSGNEVITTPMTFAATVNVIEHVGAKPVFVDINPDNLTIDVRKIEKKINKKTRAIIPVHFAGHPARLDEIQYLAKKYNLAVIEDAAHAIESKYRGRKIGNISDFTAFSFYATKNITTAEGGILTTNNKTLAERIEILSLHGMTKDAWKRYTHKGIVQNFEIIYPGFKYNMFDIQASLGINQLKRIGQLYNRRKHLYKRYESQLKNLDCIQLLKEDRDIVHSYHLFVLLLNLDKLKITRDHLRFVLDQHNIGTGVHYISLHRQPYYLKKYKFKAQDFPIANDVSARTFSLPLYVNLKEEDQDYITDTLRKILKKYKR